MKNFKYLIAITLSVSISACTDFIEIEPQGEIIADQALQDAEDMQELLNSAYDALRGTGGDWLGGRAQAISEIMGENIDGSPGNLNNADFLAYYNKTSSIFTGYTQNMFDEPYYVIYRANVLLENLDRINLTEAERDRIEGEAKFLRALNYFELVKLFGQPYGFTPDNSHLGVVLRTVPNASAQDRNTVNEIYAQIGFDLADAVQLLPNENGNYATSWSAKAYLSKVYFHMHMYQEAFDLATDVIENGPAIFNPSSEEYSNRFSPDGTEEALFEMISFDNDHRGPQFNTHFRSDTETRPTLAISRDLYNLATQSSADIRGQEWYTVTNEGAGNERIELNKFNANYFNVPLMHITELKLIRAEAAAELGTAAALSVGIEDVNDIRARAGLPAIANTTIASSLLNIVREEKRKELVGEGQYFHDLRRIGASGENLLIRGSAWDCPGMAIQFPDGEVAGAGGADSFTLNPEGGC